MKRRLMVMLVVLGLVVAGCGGTSHQRNDARVNSKLTKINSTVGHRTEMSARGWVALKLDEGRPPFNGKILRELKHGCPHADRNELADALVTLQHDVASIHSANALTKSIEEICAF